MDSESSRKRQRVNESSNDDGGTYKQEAPSKVEEKKAGELKLLKFWNKSDRNSGWPTVKSCHWGRVESK